jgi:hypothetical protein
VNKAERDIRVAQAAANTAAAPKPVATVPAPTVTQPAAAVNEAEAARVASLPIDERCKAQWEANTGGVRGEFTSLAEMTAYAKAVESGKVKQIGRKAA